MVSLSEKQNESILNFKDSELLNPIFRVLSTNLLSGYSLPEDLQCNTTIVAYSGNVIRKSNCILHPNVLEIGSTSLKQLYGKCWSMH